MAQQGTFDDLNAALFAQMDRLANAEGEALDAEIERSGAMSKLAGNVIANYNAAVNLMRFQREEGMEAAGLTASQPRMLGGSPDGAPSDDPDAWIAANAPKHTVTYMAEKLGWDYEQVVSACDRLGVAPLVAGQWRSDRGGYRKVKEGD